MRHLKVVHLVVVNEYLTWVKSRMNPFDSVSSVEQVKRGSRKVGSGDT